jgi:hypothetical protein
MSAQRVLAALFAYTLIALAFLVPVSAQSPVRKPAVEPYSWKNVQIVGGGFVVVEEGAIACRESN